MKHKHAELIKAWADGAIIQLKVGDARWIDSVDNDPSWDIDSEYRIKPEPKPDVVRYTVCDVRLDRYSVTPSKYDGDNLKLTFCGETGKLMTAEVL